MITEKERDEIIGRKGMQELHAYRKHVLSDQLSTRHPYLDPDFRERYDETEVYMAVFDRQLPKLVEIIFFEDIDDHKYFDALRALNEMCSHQENKSKLIALKTVSRCLHFLEHPDASMRAEAASLLGSLLSVMEGRSELEKIQSFDPIFKVLNDESLRCRTIMGWCIHRLVLGRDGTELAHSRGLTSALVTAFIKYSKVPKVEEAEFLIEISTSLGLILQNESNTDIVIGTGITKSLNDNLVKLSSKQIFDKYSERITAELLEILSLIGKNFDGKDELIEVQAISTANRFLKLSHEEILRGATKVVMFATLQLEGKNQAMGEDELVIKNLIALLYSKHPDLKTNCKISLQNIADNPKGFAIIVKYMASHFPLMIEIFGPRAIVPLAANLEDGNNLGKLQGEALIQKKSICKAICQFIMNKKTEKEALGFAIKNVVKISEKLFHFLLIRHDQSLVDGVAATLHKICKNDEINRNTLKVILVSEQESSDSSTDKLPVSEPVNYQKLLQLLDE